MKKTTLGKRLISFLMLLSIAAALFGCTAAQPVDLTADISPNTPEVSADLSSSNETVFDFALRLMKAAEEPGKNTLVSPLSVLCALTMTANGARETTCDQMEAVLGLPVAALNDYVRELTAGLTQSTAGKLHIANSIWFTDDARFTVDQDFLQTNADYFGAGLYKAPFSDQTRKAINDWVKQETDGMIPEIVDKIPAEAVMYLVNALAFEAEWAEKYEQYQVHDGTFTREDGTTETVSFMYSSEQLYLEDENAVGFIKYYQGRRYAFAALLPNEGFRISDYVEALDSEALYALLSNPQYVTVNAALPKFETEYSTELSDALKGMGMTDAFNAALADFTGLGTSTGGNIFINRVLHKTFISVGEQGTRAGAATVVEMADGAALDEIMPKEVYLDRPFVYMLLDCETNTPFFIGTVMALN